MAQNFSGQNLRGQSFKDRNLQGANFSHADIRNINFTNANLRNTDFSHAKAGIQPYLAVLLLNSSFLCSALLGVALELGLRAVLPRPDSKPIIGMAVFLLLVTFYTITIQRGLAGAALATVSIAIIVTVVGVGVGIGPGFEAEASVGAMTGVLSVALVGLGVVAVSIVGALAMIITEIKAITGVVVSALFGACVVAITGIIDQLTIVVIAITGTATILGAYVAIRALAGDQKFAFVNPIAINFAANGGTSFCGANLTDANFSQATLKSTDFRGATVTRTCWFQARKLSFACVGKTTYLKNSQVRQLVITGQGQEKNFDHQNLRGVNLKGANLVHASFIGADLSQANLQDADLSRAKLVQTQLDGTDFTGATLTAAYIQDWGITTDTKFDGVRCEYVFMRLPTKEDPDPHSKQTR